MGRLDVFKTLLICLAILVGAFGFTAGGIVLWERMSGSHRTASQEVTPNTATDDTDDVVTVPVEDPDATDSDVEGKKETPAEDKDAPEVRNSLDDYSWEELAQIAALIEECSSSSDALSVAKDYHLVATSGSYPGTTKTVRMSDGNNVRFRLVGVWHDDADTTSGKAGLSFLATNIVYRHRVGSGTSLSGGWQQSELRSWLQTDVYRNLPSELSTVLLPASKKTNNAGKTDSLSSVTQTSDTLWAPSIVELCGPVNWSYSSNPDKSPFYNSVFNAEGSQYEAFAQVGIASEDSNTSLALGSDWWMRSSAASTGRSRYVDSSGTPCCFDDSNKELGIVFGFCL